jgi:hypothetical protein
LPEKKANRNAGPTENGYASKRNPMAAQPIHARDRFFGSSLMPSPQRLRQIATAVCRMKIPTREIPKQATASALLDDRLRRSVINPAKASGIPTLIATIPMAKNQ